ncbi:MAG: exo-alpha-sialidase [Clostridia bacterium]|nr:exo-alpha-sialidase [Clostridia bacterium]
MERHIVSSFGPDGQYTRHSEGAFLRMKDGGIYFAYSRFTGSGSDAAPSNIAAMVSYDEGETWTEPETVIDARIHGVRNVMSVSMMRMQDGEMGLFYIVKATRSINRIILARSKDEGKSFYSHTVCTLGDREGYYVLNNDRVERLMSGRLIMPLAFHRGGYDEGSAYFDGRAYDCFLCSDDDGRTWFESRDAVFPPFAHSNTGLQEPGIIELKNGMLWGYARTDQMAQYEFFSMDSGNTWTAAQPSRFTSPPSPMKIKRNPATGDLYAVWNPVPNYNGKYTSRAGWGRTPLVWSVSRDDGKSWSGPQEIEGGPEHGYCYPAIFFTDDNAMLAAYCAGGPEDGACLCRLSIQKIPI